MREKSPKKNYWSVRLEETAEIQLQVGVSIT